MPAARAKDGRVVRWSGLARCLDYESGEVFNSVAAFDAYRRKVAKHGPKSPSKFGMVKNAAGYWVTRLRAEAQSFPSALPVALEAPPHSPVEGNPRPTLEGPLKGVTAGGPGGS